MVRGRVAVPWGGPVTRTATGLENNKTRARVSHMMRTVIGLLASGLGPRSPDDASVDERQQH
jgi:hypothetical protein